MLLGRAHEYGLAGPDSAASDGPARDLDEHGPRVRGGKHVPAARLGRDGARRLPRPAAAAVPAAAAAALGIQHPRIDELVRAVAVPCGPGKLDRNGLPLRGLAVRRGDSPRRRVRCARDRGGHRKVRPRSVARLDRVRYGRVDRNVKLGRCGRRARRAGGDRDRKRPRLAGAQQHAAAPVDDLVGDGSIDGHGGGRRRRGRRRHHHVDAVLCPGAHHVAKPRRYRRGLGPGVRPHLCRAVARPGKDGQPPRPLAHEQPAGGRMPRRAGALANAASRGRQGGSRLCRACAAASAGRVDLGARPARPAGQRRGRCRKHLVRPDGARRIDDRAVPAEPLRGAGSGPRADPPGGRRGRRCAVGRAGRSGRPGLQRPRPAGPRRPAHAHHRRVHRDKPRRDGRAAAGLQHCDGRAGRRAARAAAQRDIGVEHGAGRIAGVQQRDILHAARRDGQGQDVQAGIGAGAAAGGHLERGRARVLPHAGRRNRHLVRSRRGLHGEYGRV